MSIVSDWDPGLTFNFFAQFYKTIQMRQDMSVTFDPTTKDQTEKMNHYVEIISRALVNPSQ